MQIKKIVFFTEPGEKAKLNSLALKHTNESTLAMAIEKEFNVSFNEAITIAEIWLKVINLNKN